MISSSSFSSSDLQVLYEDNHLIAVFKPAGVLTQADSSGVPSLMEVTKEWLRTRHQKPGNVFLGLLHRLDKPVAGIVLFARTSKGASRLSEQFRARTLRKIYWAVVEGTTAPSKILTHYLSSEAVPRVQVFEAAGPELKRAGLTFRTLKSGNGKSLLEVELETGRKHQIRAQLSYIGHPILGDKKYGSTTAGPNQGIALVAKRLEFRHPVRIEESITVEVSPLLCPLKGLLP